MSIFEAIILGAIQGLTEFLPVSSSGHIEIAKFFLNVEIQEDIAFTLFLHLGTVLSTIIVFRKDITKIITGFFFTEKHLSARPYVLRLFISLLPLLPMVFFKSKLETIFGENLLFVGYMLLLTSFLLGFAQFKRPNTTHPITLKDAILIGIAQACAVLPGLSRSGSTIATGLSLGVDKQEVARFSFLMVIPAIIGGTLLEVIEKGGFPITAADVPMWVTAFVVSFVVGLLACKLMVRLVSKAKLLGFVIYCFIMGLICIYFGWVGDDIISTNPTHQ